MHIRMHTLNLKICDEQIFVRAITGTKSDSKHI